MNLQLVYRYILSLSKNKNMFYEKKKQKNGDKLTYLPIRRPYWINYWCTKTVHKYGVSIQSSTKVRETFRQITQKLWATRPETFYKLVCYNISFSWLLSVDGLKMLVKLIIFNTFAHEILPVDAVWSR